MSQKPYSENVLYLEVEDVLGLYADLFGLNDQQVRDRLRDEAGLQGALSRPQSHAHYEGADVAMQAAVLAHGIAEGQYFLEGNKRTALVSLRTFLQLNGYSVQASQQQRAGWILALSQGLPVSALAARIRQSLVEIGPAAE